MGTTNNPVVMEERGGGDQVIVICDSSPSPQTVVEEDDSYYIEGEDDEEEERDVEEEEPIVSSRPKPWNHFRWLQLDSSIRLNLAGTDWSPRIEMEAVPSGRSFHHTVSAKREGKSGRLIPDQKLFCLLNSRNQNLLAIDFSNDLKSFHVMEPDSQRFIAFFTLPCFKQEESTSHRTVHIHNVIDEEIYVVESLNNRDLSIPIKSATGEELAVIMRPPPKWTQSQPGLMTLHFSGDDREGLTCRERAIILGFFIAIGIQAMSLWKRSSVGILAVYVLSAVLGCFMVLFLYIALRNDLQHPQYHQYRPFPSNLTNAHNRQQQTTVYINPRNDTFFVVSSN